MIIVHGDLTGKMATGNGKIIKAGIQIFVFYDYD